MDMPDSATIHPQQFPYQERVLFLTELAKRLHFGGATAQRLEKAMTNASERFGIHCEPFVQPTGIILSFSDSSKPSGSTDITRVIRLPFVETNLRLLSEADRIAESVADGSLSLPEGYRQMAALDQISTSFRVLLKILALTGLASGIAMLLRLPWPDVGVATFNGFLAGVLGWYASSRPRLHEAITALTAFICTSVVLFVESFFVPLNQNTVIIASLVALMPGMHLTNSINELCAGHLSAGVARFAGAVSIMLQLCVGALIAFYIFNFLGVSLQVRPSRPQPVAVEMLGMALAASSFAVLFQATRRDFLYVICAACLGYLLVKFGGDKFGAPAGVFISACVLTGLGNLFGRVFHRPGAIIRIPGIVMLVPGSASVKALLNVLQQNVEPGEGILAIAYILMAIVAGIIFGNLFVPTRSTL